MCCRVHVCCYVHWVQESREELITDIDDLKKKISGADQA